MSTEARRSWPDLPLRITQNQGRVTLPQRPNQVSRGVELLVSYNAVEHRGSAIRIARLVLPHLQRSPTHSAPGRARHTRQKSPTACAWAGASSTSTTQYQSSRPHGCGRFEQWDRVTEGANQGAVDGDGVLTCTAAGPGQAPIAPCPGRASLPSRQVPAACRVRG